LSLLVKGGVVLVPIVALSVIPVALIIQKGGYFLSIRNPYPDIGAWAIQRLRAGQASALLAELEGMRCPEARVLLIGLQARKAGLGDELVVRQMESQAMRSADELEKNVAHLSSIANLATLLGLLGTVTGMIRSFLNLRVSGVADPARLAGGISEALITTAAGLIVAIPSLLCYHLFRQRVNSALARMEIAGSELQAYLGRQRLPRPRPPEG
jgi:biopolymer transport protein ExbB